jgi:hypothetical protein
LNCPNYKRPTECSRCTAQRIRLLKVDLAFVKRRKDVGILSHLKLCDEPAVRHAE